MSKAFEVDLQQQIDQIKAMIDFNGRKAGEYLETPIEKRTMTGDQYMSLLKRTDLMTQCLRDIENLSQ